jgi:hypothetical protein
VLHDRKKHNRIKKSDPSTIKIRKAQAQQKWRMRLRANKSYSRIRKRNPILAEQMVHRRIEAKKKDKVYYEEQVKKKVPSERRRLYY